jgi:hypothetical protein
MRGRRHEVPRPTTSSRYHHSIPSMDGQVYPKRSSRVKNNCLSRCSLRCKRLRLSLCGIYGGVRSRVCAASKFPRQNILAAKPAVMTAASLILPGELSAWPMAFKTSVSRPYMARIFLFREPCLSGGGGLPPITSEEEPQGCQQAVTWVDLRLFAIYPTWGRGTAAGSAAASPPRTGAARRCRRPAAGY